ncbi:MAG: urea ABC transporter permease subunit UrtC, partial [Microcystaceae cyanobacterium]
FFQGALFLIVVTVLPSGIVGWFQESGWQQVRSLLGIKPPVATYPSLELSPEVQQEREQLESPSQSE